MRGKITSLVGNMAFVLGADGRAYTAQLVVDDQGIVRVEPLPQSDRARPKETVADGDAEERDT